MIGPWKMRPVGTLTFHVTSTSPLIEMFTKREREYHSVRTLTFFENRFGKRKIKGDEQIINAAPAVLRWKLGGPLPHGVEPL